MADKKIEIEVVTKADTTELDDLKDKLDEVKTGADNINGEGIDELSQSSEEAANSIGSAASKTDELGNNVDSINSKGMDDVSDGAREVEKETSNADTQVQNLQGDLNLLEAGALLSIAGEIGQLGSAAEGMTQDMNVAAITVGQLATQTGIAEPQMVSLINNISNATFPNDEAMMYVKSLDQIGVSSGNLGASATNLDKINDAFGLGADRVNSLGQELSVLGVDMNHVETAFNALAYANANTVGGMDNYYTFLRKYDAQFKELGFDVDQASVIIAAATQKFGGGKAALSGLSDALKEANGDTRALEEALDLEAGSISNASQLTGQYSGVLGELADEEREHKSWLDQINAAWEDISLSMSPVLSPITSFMGVIGQAGSWAVSVNGLFKLRDNFRKLDIIEKVGGWLGTFKGRLIDVASATKTALLQIISFAKTLATTVYSAVVSAAKALYELALNVLTTGYNALKSAAMWVVEKAALVASEIASKAAAAAQWLLNIAMDANPVMLVVLAIIALIAVLGYLYFNNEQVRAAIDGLGQALWGIGETIYGYLLQAFDMIVSTLQGVWEYITTLGGLLPANVNLTGNQILDTIIRVMTFMATLPFQIGMIFINIIAKTLGFGDNFVQNMFKAGSNAVTRFIGSISKLSSGFMDEVNKIIQDALNFAGRIGDILWQAGINAIKGFLGGLDRHSPGKMQREFVAEINEMGDRVPTESRKLISNMGFLGQGIVEAFGSPNLSGEFGNVSINNNSNGAGGGDMIFNLYGDMDEESRMRKFIDGVIRELNWNNETAGRTI